MADSKWSVQPVVTSLAAADTLLAIATGVSSQITSQNLGKSLNPFSYFTKVGTAFLGGDQTGNARGTLSLDVQSQHFAVTQVASGNNAFAFGKNNTASGGNCVAVGISNNISSASGSFGVGFFNTCPSGTNSSAFGAYNTTQTGNSASAFGFTNTVSALGGSAFGASNTVNASANKSSAFGSGNTIAASNTNASAFGYANPITGGVPGISAFGYKNGASGNNSSSFGNSNTSSNTRSNAFGRSNQATAVDSSAFGGYNLASNTGASAFGKKNTASGTNTSAFGYYSSASTANSSAFGYRCSVLTGAASNAFGYSAVNRIATTTVINGPILARKDNGEGAGNAFYRWNTAEVVLFTQQVDFSVGATFTITLPAGCHFYPSAVGITCTQFNAATIQPTCSFGFTGSNAALKAAAITTNLTATFTREEYTTLLSLTGRTSLTATITVASTSTPNYFGRFYFKGLLVEDN